MSRSCSSPSSSGPTCSWASCISDGMAATKALRYWERCVDVFNNISAFSFGTLTRDTPLNQLAEKISALTSGSHPLSRSTQFFRAPLSTERLAWGRTTHWSLTRSAPMR